MTSDDPPATSVTTVGAGPTDATTVVLDFGDFYTARFDPVARALAVTLGDDDLATEATTEAMARAWERWGRVGGYDNPSGWVYRVGLNWARSRLRRAWREVTRRDTPERAATPAAPTDPALAAALAELPVEQRAVVVARHLLDWSEKETAEALGISPGTVKSRLSRALDRLAHLLEDDDA